MHRLTIIVQCSVNGSDGRTLAKQLSNFDLVAQARTFTTNATAVSLADFAVEREKQDCLHPPTLKLPPSRKARADYGITSSW